MSITPLNTSIMHNKKKRISRKQSIWLRHYIATGNATDSARKAYRVSTVVAQQIGYENLKKLEYPQYLEEAGITDNLLRHKLAEGLDANKVVSSANAKDITRADNNDFIDVPDYAVRHKYLETAYKLKKRLDQPVSNTVNIDKVMILDGTTAPSDVQPIDATIVEDKPIT